MGGYLSFARQFCGDCVHGLTDTSRLLWTNQRMWVEQIFPDRNSCCDSLIFRAIRTAVIRTLKIIVFSTALPGAWKLGGLARNTRTLWPLTNLLWPFWSLLRERYVVTGAETAPSECRSQQSTAGHWIPHIARYTAVPVALAKSLLKWKRVSQQKLLCYSRFGVTIKFHMPGDGNARRSSIFISILMSCGLTKNTACTQFL